MERCGGAWPAASPLQPGPPMTAVTEREAPPGRASFKRFHTIATRWSDNDVYGHLNNVVYYWLFDTAVNAILIEGGHLDPRQVPSSDSWWRRAAAIFPACPIPTLPRSGRRSSIGRSSVRYRLAVFGAGASAAAQPDNSPTSMSTAKQTGRSRFRTAIAGSWRASRSSERPNVPRRPRVPQIPASMTDIFTGPRSGCLSAGVSQFSVIVPREVDRRSGARTKPAPATLAGATAKRRLEFRAGRACARRAIERIGFTVAAGALARDVDGVPVWPDGVVGSITHAGRLATAAVAKASEAFGLGVDVEAVMSEQVAADIAGLIASEQESVFVTETLRLARLETLTLVFSIKESVFKAVYPPTRRHFDYLDCAVVGLDPDGRRFAVRFRPPFDAAYGVRRFRDAYEFQTARSDRRLRSGAALRLRRKHRTGQA